MIGESIAFMNKQICLSFQQIIFPHKLKLEQGKQYSESKLDVLAAVNLALKMLDGPSTRERRLILKLAIHMIFTLDLKEEEIEELKKLLSKLGKNKTKTKNQFLNTKKI